MNLRNITHAWAHSTIYGLFFFLSLSVSVIDVNTVHNANNNGDDTGMLVLQHLARAAAFSVYQHGIADAGLGVIQRDEISAFVFGVERERLDDQQAVVLVSRMANSGNNCSDNFSDDHAAPLSEIIAAFLQRVIDLAVRAHIQLIHVAH